MSREKELGQALNKLISQTEDALDGGWIYTEEFREHLIEARKAIVDEEVKEDYSYPAKAPGFHVIQQQ